MAKRTDLLLRNGDITPLPIEYIDPGALRGAIAVVDSKPVCYMWYYPYGQENPGTSYKIGVDENCRHFNIFKSDKVLGMLIFRAQRPDKFNVFHDYQWEFFWSGNEDQTMEIENVSCHVSTSEKWFTFEFEYDAPFVVLYYPFNAIKYLTSLTNAVNVLAQNVNTQGTKIATNTTNISQNATDILTVQNDLIAARRLISGNISDISTLKGNVKALVDSLSNVKDNVRDQGMKLDTVSSKLDTYANYVDHLITEFGNISKRMDTAESQIANLNGKVGGLEMYQNVVKTHSGYLKTRQPRQTRISNVDFSRPFNLLDDVPSGDQGREFVWETNTITPESSGSTHTEVRKRKTPEDENRRGNEGEDSVRAVRQFRDALKNKGVKLGNRQDRVREDE